MLAIYKKEMRSYFINPIGYVFAGVFFIMSALLCCYTTIKANSYSTADYFTFLIMAFIILIPLLTLSLEGDIFISILQRGLGAPQETPSQLPWFKF